MLHLVSTGAGDEELGACQGRRAKPCRRVSMDDHGEGCVANERTTMLEPSFCFASTGEIQSWNHSYFLLQPISELETQLVFATTISFFLLHLASLFATIFRRCSLADDDKQLQQGDQKSCNPRREKVRPATKKATTIGLTCCNQRRQTCGR